MTWIVVVAGALAWVGGPQVADGEMSREVAQRMMLSAGDSAAVLPTRLVQLYDFEDVDDAGIKIGASLSHAPDWYPIGRDPQESDPSFSRQPLHEQMRQRRNYPTYCDVRMDNQAARSGDYSLHLELRGGNVGAFVEVGAVPAVPGSDYMVSAAIRTDQLVHSGAWVTAYFVDARGDQIAKTVNRIGPVRTKGRWEQVSLPLHGEHEGVAWIGIEVELIQPNEQEEHPLGDEQVILTDIRGGVWFDDIAVWQVPHVQVSTQSNVNIIRAPDQPRIDVSVRDLTGQRLVAKAAVYDDKMRLVASEERRVGAGAPGNWSWTPTLPGYGWYRLDLSAVETEGQAQGQVIAHAGGAFLWHAEKKPMPPSDRGRFALIAEGVPPAELELLDEVLLASSLYATTISAFDAHTTLADLEQGQAAINRAIEKALMSGRSVTLSLEPVPVELTQSVGLDVVDAMTAMQKASDAWLSYLTPVVMRHGQRVRRWQVGSTLEPDAFFAPQLSRATNEFLGEFGVLAPDPKLVLPWSLDQARRSGVPESYEYAVLVPAGLVPREITEYLSHWRSPAAEMALELASDGADQVPQDQRVRDLALRMMYGWEQDPASLSVRQPWGLAGKRRAALVPDPRLGVFSNVAHCLAGRRVVGRLSAAPGVECMILDGPPGGMLAVWNEQGADDAELAMYLGPDPVATDIWGNQRKLTLVDGKHRMTVPRTPVFIEGVDAKLALFRGAFKITPPFVESMQGTHERVITLSNPFGRTISGKLTITGPEGWRSAPHTHFFSIASGKTIQLPVTLSFPIVEVAGYKELTARVSFRAGQQYDIDLSTPMELGLTAIDYNAAIALVEGDAPGTVDAVVSAAVTNKSKEEISLYVFASLAGYPRQERSVPSLEPGQSAARSFRFEDVGQTIKTYPIRAGVREDNGPAILNQVQHSGAAK